MPTVLLPPFLTQPNLSSPQKLVVFVTNFLAAYSRILGLAVMLKLNLFPVLPKSDTYDYTSPLATSLTFLLLVPLILTIGLGKLHEPMKYPTKFKDQLNLFLAATVYAVFFTLDSFNIWGNSPITTFTPLVSGLLSISIFFNWACVAEAIRSPFDASSSYSGMTIEYVELSPSLQSVKDIMLTIEQVISCVRNSVLPAYAFIVAMQGFIPYVDKVLVEGGDWDLTVGNSLIAGLSVLTALFLYKENLTQRPFPNNPFAGLERIILAALTGWVVYGARADLIRDGSKAGWTEVAVTSVSFLVSLINYLLEYGLRKSAVHSDSYSALDDGSAKSDSSAGTKKSSSESGSPPSLWGRICCLCTLTEEGKEEPEAGV